MDKKDNAQEANQQVLKFGDVVLLQCVEHNGFVSCTPHLSPNVRVNQLSPGISSPLDVTACMLEVRQRYQYTERRALDAVLQHQGLSLEDINAQTNANKLEHSKTFNQDLMRRLSQKVMSFRRPSASGMDLSKLGRSLVHLYEAYLKERAVNNDEFVRMVGQQVLYGQVVQLRDTITGKFLTIKRTAAEVERGALKVMLEDGGNTGSWFTVMSGYSTKVEGDKVLFDEVISLSSATFSGMCLHLSVNSIVQPQMMPVRRHRYLLEAHEIAASPDAVRVKVIPHSLHPDQAPECAELLCGCVAVTIVHKISGNLLVVHNEQVYFSETMADGDDGEAVIPGIAVWRIEPVDLSWMGMPFDYNREFRLRNIVSGMYLASPKWVIGEDPGKAATFKSATGALVGLGTVGAIAGGGSFRTKTEGGSRPMTPLAIDSRPATIPEAPELTGDSPPDTPQVPSPVAPKSSASMAKARDNEAELALQGSYQSTNLQVMFDYEHEACKWKLNTFVKDVDASLLKSSFAFIRHTRDQWMGQGAPVRVAGLEGTFYHPRISNQREDRNVMAINAIAPEFVVSVEAVGAVLITMKTFAKQLQANPCKATEDMEAEQIASAVKDPAFLNVFREYSYRASALLNEMIEEMDKSRPRVDLEAAVMYQTLCRECRVLCAIADCLAAIPYKALFKVNLKSAPTSLQNVVSFGALCHKFFQVCCMGNSENQRFLLRHLDVITKHLGGPLKAADTLAAMYDNNMELIQNIDETIICQFISLVKTSGRRPRFVNFLHKVCGSKDRPVPQNQNWIIDTLKERPRDLLIQARIEERPSPNGLQDVLVLKADREVLCGRFTGIQEDKKNASVFTWDRAELRLESDPDYTLFLYYLFSLHLVCSLCYGRNNHARDTLLSLSAQHGLGYEFDLLLSVATNTNMPNVIRSTMLQLLQNMYVDVDPHTRVLLPRLTRLLTLDNGEQQLKLKVATREVAVKLSSNMETLTQHVVAMLAYMEALMDSRLVPDRKHGPKRMAVGFDEPDCGLLPGEVALAHEAVKALHMLMTLGILTLDIKAAGDALKVLERLTRKLNSPEDLDDDVSSKRPGKTQVGNDVVVDMKSSILALFEFSLDMWRDSVISIIFDWFVTFMKTQGDESGGAATNLPSSALQSGLGRDGGQPQGLPRIRSALQWRKVQKVAPQAAAGGRAGPAASAEAEEEGEGEHLLLSDPSLPLCVLKALKRCVERAAVEMQSRTVFHGFELFEFDVLKLEQMKGPLMTVLPLCRYQSVALASKAFELVERMVSKRRKLIQALMNTHIVCDSQSILMFHRASWILKDLMFHYKYVASSDPEERKRCIEQCISHVEELTTMVTPQQVLKVEVEVQDELDDDVQSLFISGTRAQNFQIVLYDLRAHESILSFLKLPLRTFHPRATSSDPKPMRTAKDEGRRQLFGVCYKFLVHFCVCTDGVGSLKWGLPNRKNQEALYRHLPLFLGHVGIKALNVANTVSAILVKNLELASNIGHKIIHQFVQNIVDYGQKKRARWLDFLRSVAVIDGKPMKNNQAAILQYAADYEDEFCHFFQTPEEKERRWKLLAEKNHELDENGADAQPSELKYHRACLLLFADCCTGKETTFIVKASGFVKFDEVVKTIMMKPRPPVSSSDVRFVTTSYWTFLQYVYFSTDTENTKEAVRAANNGIWPSHGEEEAGVAPAAPSNGGCCLIQTVIDELKEAVNEPRNALQQFYSASSTLPTFVWPALQEYFANHYLQHAARLPEEHFALCWDLGECMYDYLDAIRAVDVQQYGVKHQKKAAAKATKAMLATLRAAGLIEHRSGKIADYGDASSYGGGGSVDAPTTATAISTKLIGKHWELFYTQLGLIAGLRVIPERSECYEFSRTLRDCNDNEIHYMGAFMLARVLAQPFGATIPDSSPPMSYDRVLERLSNLMRTLRDTSWPEELTVHMLKSVRGAILIDDGKASEAAWKRGWPRLMANDPPASEDEGMVLWVQQKYNLLGWTAAAVKLVCSMSPFVRMEGIEMLICLLEGGSSVVQDTLHGLVSDGSPLSVAFLTTLRDTLSSCAEHVRTSGRTLLKKRHGPKQDLESNPLAAASLAPAAKTQDHDSAESNAHGDAHGEPGHEEEETIKADGTDRELSARTLPPLLPGPAEKNPLAADGPDASETEDEEDDDDDDQSQEQEEEEEEEEVCACACAAHIVARA